MSNIFDNVKLVEENWKWKVYGITSIIYLSLQFKSEAMHLSLYLLLFNIHKNRKNKSNVLIWYNVVEKKSNEKCIIRFHYYDWVNATVLWLSVKKNRTIKLVNMISISYTQSILQWSCIVISFKVKKKLKPFQTNFTNNAFENCSSCVLEIGYQHFFFF